MKNSDFFKMSRKFVKISEFLYALTRQSGIFQSSGSERLLNEKAE